MYVSEAKKSELGYSWIKIDHIADSLLKLKIKIGVHLEHLQLPTPVNSYRYPVLVRYPYLHNILGTYVKVMPVLVVIDA